ncbi:MAG: T9SS type A sorting domain-containing protein [Bacteroidia bacterium]|nr:T9SS type A sorting domain-containing protein [Bacteroidia bacterium]
MKKTPFVFSLTLSLLILSSSFAQGVWTQKADYPDDARTAACGFVIGNGGYLGCGFDSASFRRSFNVYNPATNMWLTVSSLGGVNGSGLSRDAAVGFSIGNKGYVGTGQGSIPYLNDFWEYNPVNDTWTQKMSFPGTARRKAVGFSNGAKGYIGLGQDAVGFKNDFYEYDPGNNNWTVKAVFPGTARQLAVAFVIGTNAYVGTGDDGVNKADMYKFNTLTNTWSPVAAFPGLPRKGACAFALGGYGFVGTGYDNTLSNVADFWRYDSNNNAWSMVAAFGGGARSNMVGMMIGGLGYAGTGYEGSVKRDWWEFNPPLGVEEESSLVFSVYPNPVIDHCTVSLTEPLTDGLLTIYDLQGRRVHQQTAEGIQILVTPYGLPAGTYFLEISEPARRAVKKMLVLK